MKLTMELNNDQLQLIIHALEEYFRFRMGQADIVADSFALDTYPTEHTKESSYVWCEKREHLTEVIRAAVKINYGDLYYKSSDECRSVSDLWSCLRHANYLMKPHDDGWDVRSAPPIQLGVYPLPVIKIENDVQE